MPNVIKSKYNTLLKDIGSLLAEGRKQAFRIVNNILVKTYWNIGKCIVEHEQQGEEKAEYGSKLLKNLSRDLKLLCGKGFSKSNIYLMRLFYLQYEKFQTVSGKLSWSHYSELLSVFNDNLPVDILLGADKDEILVDYATGSISNQLFASRYQLYIPDKKMLADELKYLLPREKIKSRKYV